MRRIYKIYINEQRLLISTSSLELEAFPNLLIIKGNKRSTLREGLELLEKGLTKEVGLVFPSEDHIMDVLEEHFKIIEAAGGLVFNEQEEALFIHRKGKWDLPKGKIDKDEDPESAAFREIEEECGIKADRILENLPDTYHIYQEHGKTVLKKVFWYKMSYSGKHVGNPQHEEDITEVRWLKKENWDVILENTYPLIADLISEQRS